MASPSYVWEKMYVAIDILCSVGTFKNRLYRATTNALDRLEDDDLEGELAADLSYVLDRTKRNVAEYGGLRRRLGELERRKLIETMLHILIKTKG
jgi:hypothetical protein